MTWNLGQAGGNATTYIQIIIWGIFISLTVIGWIVKVVVQKREEARIRTAKRRREEDLLRTGRNEDGSTVSQPLSPVAATGPASHEEARKRLQEIAQRRRAELEQMARQGDVGRPAGSPAAPTPPAARGVPTSKPFQPRPMAPVGRAFPTAAPKPQPQRAQPFRPEPLRPEPSRPKSGSRQDQRKKQKSQENRPSPSPPGPRQPTLAEKLMEPTAAPSGAYAVAPQPSAPVAAGSAAVGRGTRVSLGRATTPAGIESLRQALVMAEVLAPPVSMRPETDGIAGDMLMQRAG